MKREAQRQTNTFFYVCYYNIISIVFSNQQTVRMSSAGGDGDLGDAGGSDDGGDWGESNNGFADMDWDVASALDASSATHLVGETEAHFHDIDNILASEVGTYVFLDPTESNDGRALSQSIL